MFGKSKEKEAREDEAEQKEFQAQRRQSKFMGDPNKKLPKKSEESTWEALRSQKTKLKSEMNEKEILLEILEKLESIEEYARVEDNFKHRLRMYLDSPAPGGGSQSRLYDD
jgi:NH3-dependent NAD+ synthetase